MSVPADLFEAVRSRNPDRVREVLQRDPRSVMARDSQGATALHYAAESGDREIVTMLLDGGADINARDQRFHATPAGWGIEYLRERGGLLGYEIEDAAHAISIGDVGWMQRFLTRFPALRHAVDRSGAPLEVLARSSGNREIARLFEIELE
ncbi:MAG: ankyrin repeat domain-containing protein [Thermoanaerobaculia bacterium]